MQQEATLRCPGRAIARQLPPKPLCPGRPGDCHPVGAKPVDCLPAQLPRHPPLAQLLEDAHRPVAARGALPGEAEGVPFVALQTAHRQPI